MSIFSFFTKRNIKDIEDKIDCEKFNVNKNDNFFIKLKSKCTHDNLQYAVICASCGASASFRNELNNYLDKLNTILSIKRQSSDNLDDGYIDILIKNIIYISNLNSNIKENIVHYLTNQTILSSVQYDLLISKLEEKFKISNYKFSDDDNVIKETYLKQNSSELLIQELETDYIYNLTYFEILNATLKKLFDFDDNLFILERNPKDMIALVDYYIRINTSEILKNK